ncbi:DUF6765 family protein [Pseudoduganella aquatica]|uniref:RHS repeat protein n=1 Tax=Pseudoduganella aquatica TaxID=2660641 RepID=A0A7X4HCU8_9BURK|nr:DUF6765 family protein [Pseudoduganella aquatica]MYN08012.1 hypothetical protein [Pseudoduganella aquatica]
MVNAIYKSVLASALLALAGGSAYACGPGGSGQTCDLGTAAPASQSAASVNVGAGNPINVISGNKYQRETDMPALPGVLGLEIVRHYNSSLSAANMAPGSVGRGWKLSYETELYAFDSTVQIMQADGSRLIFSRDLLNPSLCASADPANGTLAISGARGREQYVWTWTDGRELTFDHRGKLNRIKAASGEVLTLLYDPHGLLVKVTDPQGRSLRLSYLDRESVARGDRFRGVQSITTPVGRFAYEYGSAMPKGASAPKNSVLANLVRVRYPSASAAAAGRTYQYEDVLRPTYLTGISFIEEGKAEAQRYATFGYDENGKAVLSTHANNVDKVTLDYSQGGQTTVTNSLGQRTVYKHKIMGDAFRLLEVRGPGCALCGESNVRYGYDKLGRLTETTQLDAGGAPQLTLRAELDHYGRPLTLSKVAYRDGKAGAPQRQVRYEYGSSPLPTPVLIARPSVVPGRDYITRVRYRAGQPAEISQDGFIPTYDGKAVAQAISRTMRYQYDARGKRTEADGPLPNAAQAPGPANSDITRFEYAPATQLLSRVTLPGGETSEVLERDPALRPVRIRRSDGHVVHTITMRSNWRGQAEEVRIEAAMLKGGAPDPGTRQERVWRYRYDGQGRLLSVTQPGGLPARFDYDEAGRIVSRVMPDGSRVVTVQDSEGRTSAEARFADADLAPAKALGAVGYAYDQSGRLESLADAAGQRGRSDHTTQGQVAELSNALGASTRFEYDENGMLAVRTAAANTPDAASVKLAYDAHGSAVKITDANGVVTERRYDDFGRKVMEANADRGATLFMYDQAGHVLARIDESGSATRYRYDNAGRLLALGRDQHTELVRYRYQGWRLLETSSGADGKEEHALERTTYVYDAFGQVLSEQRWLARPDGKAGQGLRFVTGSRYDEAGHLLDQTLPDGHQLSYRYADNGQLREVLFDGQAVVGAIEQTAAGGLRGYTMGNGVRQQFELDAHGRIAELSAVARAGAAPGGWMQRIAGWFGSAPAAGPRPVYRQVNRYDEAGRLTGIEREQAGTAGTAAIARSERYGYDALDRLTRVEQGDGAVTRFAYDRGGNRIAQTTAPDAPRVIRTALDAEGAAEFGTRQHIYQPGTNRLVAQTDAAPGAPPHTASAWLYHATGVPMAQLAAGISPLRPALDPLRGQRQRIEYNSARRPVAVYGPQQQPVARYYYNSQGERIAKTVYAAAAGGSRVARTTYSLYRGQRLAAEADEQGRITAHYVYLNGKPVAKIEMAANDGLLHRAWRAIVTLNGMVVPAGPHASDSEASIFAIHGDQLGTPQAVTDSAQRVVWQASTTPFGHARVVHAAAGAAGKAFEMNLRLPGQVYDAETGLNQNYYRDYDPQLGRYTTPDPMGIEGGMNPYLYVGGNPLSNVDPLGLYQSDIHYYMNFFLAVAAGMSVEEAQVLALAAQYVDDNPETKPLNLDTGVSDAHRARLLAYHFTMVPSKIDPATGLVKGGVSDYGSPPGSAAYANIAENEQLKHLYAAVTNAGKANNLANTRCTQLQFMGEYLHSFEDTFAHRDANNNPFPLNVGLGHGGYGSNPDYTYNHWSAIPLPGAMNWNHNEERTLQMEKEVLAKLAAWKSPETKAHSFSEIESLLKQFNATEEHEGSGYDPENPRLSSKIKLLAAKLTEWGIEGLNWTSSADDEGVYSKELGEKNRAKFLCGSDGKPLDQIKYAGTILPTVCSQGE